MKAINWKKLLPHIIAVASFLIIAVLYCKPALEDKVLQQSDITQWKGAFHQSEVFQEQHGRMPLWTNSMFSGMPTFQISAPSNNIVPGYLHTIMTLGLPAPIQFFFLACICFYFLCIMLRINPYVGIMGSLAFAYATYNPVIISVGHATKMWSIAYMPALLGSFILIYEKKYWVGAALTAVFTSVLIAMNHPQVDYYFFIVVAVMTIFYAVNWIKQKEWRHLIMALSIAVGSAIIGLLTNAVNILSTYEYQKETIRGGGSALTDTTQSGNKSQTGLDKDYAFSYSMKITEPFVLMVPKMFGGSSDHLEVSEEKSQAVEALQSTRQDLGQELQRYLNFYWGGMTKPGEVGTSGPPYTGAIICFLAILSVFVIDKKYKWWMLTAIGLAIMMSWGYYFSEFNDLLFNYLPLYNKFRAPSMIMIIPQLLLPVMAVLGVNTYINTADKKTLQVKFKKGLITTGAIFLLLFFLYLSFDYLSKPNKEILSSMQTNNPQLYDSIKPFFDGLVADRKHLMITDIFRSLGFILVAALTLFLLIRKKISSLVATIILTVFIFIDLIVVDTYYLNSDNYQEKAENENAFIKTAQDEAILADKSYYRVFNQSGNTFFEAYTSYYYNSLGGYHAVKLRLYQDIIEHQLGRQQPNRAVLNMLNAKYIIQKDRAGLTQQYQKNDGALGPCWLVKHIQYVKNADEEMGALDSFNPRDTAIVQESFKPSIPNLPATDSVASISLVKNENDVMIYSFNSTANQFAVFSEVYYPRGWKAYIDNNEAPIIKTNYVLRGLPIPAGKHEIRLEFKPGGYLTGRKITSIAQLLMLGLILLCIFMEWKNRKQKTVIPGN
jgi:hypothetical protein